jgi:large subunit ribosomal protein L29
MASRSEKFRELNENELQNQIRESQEQLFRLRFQLGMGQTEGLKKYRELKRDRARMMGALSEREAKKDK